ncbi:hypothetical protein Droror1_Dr00020176, partial [Drosera rotundifolia]
MGFQSRYTKMGFAGKVKSCFIITAASSLALAGRRGDRLQEVANKTRKLGSPKLLIIAADVSKVDDNKRMIDATINNFGRVDHLMNNAGAPTVSHLEHSDITRRKFVM